MDTSKYLKRIGVEKDINETVARDYQLLHEIVESHVHNVPFENLDIHRGRRISIEIPNIYHKIVNERRGGYCFEVNGLLGWALREIGYQTTRHSARVARPALSDLWSPPTHTCNVVTINGKKYLCDVGIGSAPTGPILIEDGLEQELSDGIKYRTVHEDDTCYLQFYDKTENKWQYKIKFTYEPKEMPDFEWGNNFVQTDPNSKFIKKSVACIVGPEYKKTLAGNKFIVTNMKTGERQEREVSLEEFHELLKSEFGVVLDDENGKYPLSLEASKTAPKNFWAYL